MVSVCLLFGNIGSRVFCENRVSEGSLTKQKGAELHF